MNSRIGHIIERNAKVDGRGLNSFLQASKTYWIKLLQFFHRKHNFSHAPAIIAGRVGQKLSHPTRNLFTKLFTTVAIALIVSTSIAGPGAEKTVHVNSYQRRDGTVVREHWRSAPNSGTYVSPALANSHASIGLFDGPPITTSIQPVAPAPLKITPKYEDSKPRTEADRPKISIEPDRQLEAQMNSAKNGFAPAQYAVGMRFLTGNGLEKDRSKGLAFIRLSAEQGHSPAKEKLLELQSKRSP